MKKNLPKRVVQLVVDQFVLPDPTVPNTFWDASCWFLGPKHLPRVSLDARAETAFLREKKIQLSSIREVQAYVSRDLCRLTCFFLEVATCQIDRLLHDGLVHLWHPAKVSKAIVCTYCPTGIPTEWWNCSCKMSNPQKLEVDAMLKPSRSLLPTTHSNPVLLKLLLDSWK
jgi:hypothetical protein